MTTFITKLDSAGSGTRLAVKDIIDVADVPTTAGCRAIERSARPAQHDARCLAGARAARARVVGKTNLHELAMLPFGTNPWFGTPTNPLDPLLIPGGSSSGSAVAVATGEADVALGSDTGGSIRIPAACCGITGLKTTHGRIPLDGVWPLAPSLDTVGPMAQHVAGLQLGMELLEPGFTPLTHPARRIGRLHTSAQPQIETAVDRALAAADLEVVPIEIDLSPGTNSFMAIYFAELWDTDRHLVEGDTDGVGEDIVSVIAMAEHLRAGTAGAHEQARQWRQKLLGLFSEVELLALPAMPIFPPRLEDIPADLSARTNLAVELTRLAAPFNPAGLPCTAQPIPVSGSRLPSSLQLVGPPGSEELLLPTADTIESALSLRTQ